MTILKLIVSLINLEFLNFENELLDKIVTIKNTLHQV